MKKSICLALVGAALVLAGCASQPAAENNQLETENQNNQLPAAAQNQNLEPSTAATEDDSDQTADEYQDWVTFSNPNGGYSFKHSPDWNAAINKYDQKNSLFGVGATNESGLGGVEVTNYTGSLESYPDYQERNTEIKYLAKSNLVVDGIKGIRAEYKGFPASGFSVLIKKDGQILNFFINSKDADDVKLFDKMIETIKLSNLVYTNSTYGFTLTFPQSWKGFTAKSRTISWGTLGNSDSIDFGFPVQDSLFNISIHAKSQWQKLSQENGPKPVYLGENGQYVFAYSSAQYNADQAMGDRMTEIGRIVKTFKIIK